MKKQKSLLTITALALLCIPLAKVLIDSDNTSLINGADAKIVTYTVLLDSTNTPSMLGESALGSYQMAKPSRNVEWAYCPGSRTYPNAHMAIGDLFPDDQEFGTTNLMNFTGAVSLTLNWSLLNDLDPSNVTLMFYTPGTDYLEFADLEGLTSPHQFSRTDFGNAYRSMHLGIQLHTYSTARDAVFVLNSLEVVYDCVNVG